MSYILAALKKADEEHFLGSVPDLATPQEYRPVEPRSFRWLWLLIALLAVNAVLVAMLLKDKGAAVSTPPQAEQTSVEEQAPVTKQPPVAQAVQVPQAQQMHVADEPATAAASRVGDAPIGEAATPAPTPAMVVQKPARSVGEVVLLPDTAQSQVTELSNLPDENLDVPGDEIAATPDDPQLQSWFDLPAGIRNNLDLPRLDVHVYSENPQGRFILVNLKKYHEGDALPNGMVLEEILPDGLVMSYQGERFRVDK
jgi:general secretion pathway protein B